MSYTPSQSLPKLPSRGIYTRDAQDARVAFLETQINSPVPKTPNSRINPERLKKNIENFIGTIEVPSGLPAH
jgi:hydroxymethylglutaryl-CoA reductase